MATRKRKEARRQNLVMQGRQVETFRAALETKATLAQDAIKERDEVLEANQALRRIARLARDETRLIQEQLVENEATIRRMTISLRNSEDRVAELSKELDAKRIEMARLLSEERDLKKLRAAIKAKTEELDAARIERDRAIRGELGRRGVHH